MVKERLEACSLQGGRGALCTDGTLEKKVRKYDTRKRATGDEEELREGKRRKMVVVSLIGVP